MPETKPWEQYSNDGGSPKPWESFSDKPKSSGTDYSAIFDNPENQLENTLDDIVKTSKRSISDGERDILRNMLKDPNLTGEQAKESIQAMQGYHPKQADNTLTTPDYYVKKEANGVMRPIPLGYGERPPKGYDVAKVWGTQDQANDDSWYTDMGKSLANGAVGLVGGVIDLAQLATQGITGEESENLRAAKQSTEGLKFAKDESLNAPIFNMEGINEWSDLIDKDRYDLSPKALWGTMNMVAESAVGFLGGAGAAAKVGKGITGLNELGKGGQAASAFVGSYLTQVGEGMDAAREAGLKGRDAAAFASVTTAAKSAIDAQFGLLPNMWKNSFKASEKELLKKFAQGLEKNADGTLTEASLKQLGKEFSVDYAKMASIGIKEVAKDAAKEGLQEGSQDFVQKAAENLWDKMSKEDKAKFGTDAFSPKSFGSYMNSIATGLVGGVPMAVASTNYKKKYNEQSTNALNVVEGGKDKMDEFKANAYAAARRGEITEQERDNAINKIDRYNVYAEQTKDLPNLTKEEKKKAFELSFNIDSIKQEISKFTPEDIEKLDPIARAKINSKETIAKDLQKDLNRLLLKQDIQTETRAGDDSIKKVAKDVEPETPPMRLSQLLKKLKPETATETKPDNIVSNEIDFEVKNPKSMARIPVKQFTTAGWNQMAQDNPMRTKAIVGEHLKTLPNNQQKVTVRSGKNKTLTFDIGDNKQVKAAQSVASGEGTPNYFNYKNLPEKRVEVLDKGGNPVLDEQGEPEFYYEEPVIMKRLDFTGRDKNGKLINKAVVAVYNEKTGGFISQIREHSRGKSDYSSELDQYHLKKINNSNLYDEELKKYAYKPDKVVEDVKITDYTKLAKNAETEKELDAILDQADKAGAEIDIDVVAKRRGSLKPKETKVEKAPKVEVVKPELSLESLPDKFLDKDVFTVMENEETGEQEKVSVKAKKLQAEIKKKFKLLEKLNDCIHG